jgi:hypothetical protein
MGKPEQMSEKPAQKEMLSIRKQLDSLHNEIEMTPKQMEEIALKKGEEFYVLWKLLHNAKLAQHRIPENELNKMHKLSAESIRTLFTKERAQNFGFYYSQEKKAWYTVDVSENIDRDYGLNFLKYGMDEKQNTPNFLEAFDKKEGIRTEILDDDNSITFDQGLAIHNIIFDAREAYRKYSLITGKKSV